MDRGSRGAVGAMRGGTSGMSVNRGKHAMSEMSEIRGSRERRGTSGMSGMSEIRGNREKHAMSGMSEIRGKHAMSVNRGKHAMSERREKNAPSIQKNWYDKRERWELPPMLRPALLQIGNNLYGSLKHFLPPRTPKPPLQFQVQEHFFCLFFLLHFL